MGSGGGSEWSEHMTSDGRKFYYNRRTKKSSWTLPEELSSNRSEGKGEDEPSSSGDIWEKRLDQKSGRVFYYNRQNRKSVWTLPQGPITLIDKLSRHSGAKKEAGSEAARDEDSIEKKSEADHSGREVEDKKLEKGESSHPTVQPDTVDHPAQGNVVSSEAVEASDERRIVKDQHNTDADPYSEVNGATHQSHDDDVPPMKRGLDALESDALADLSEGFLGSPEAKKTKVDAGAIATQALQETDSVMNSDVLSHIETYLQEAQTSTDMSGIEFVVKSLSTSYHGFAQIAALQCEWIDDVLCERSNILKKLELARSVSTGAGHPPGEENIDLAARKATCAKSSSDVVRAHLHEQVLERYQPTKLTKVLEGSNEEPPWLGRMLQDGAWRHLLIDLADKHKACGLLSYAMQRMSAGGRHREIAQARNSAAFFNVFEGIFVDALKRVIQGDATLSSEIHVYWRLACHSEFAFLYTQELLCRLENGPVNDNFLQMLNSLAESTDHPPQSKLSDVALQGRLRWLRNGIEEAAYNEYKETFVRLCQLSLVNVKQSWAKTCEGVLSMIVAERALPQIARDLADDYRSKFCPPIALLRSPAAMRTILNTLFHPYDTLGDSHRRDCSFLLSLIACGLDPRSPDDGTIPDSSVKMENQDSTEQAIWKASRICNAESALSFEIQQPEISLELRRQMKFPVVSLAVLHWMRTAVLDARFHNGTMYPICLPVFLQLTETIMQRHPLQRKVAFDFLTICILLKTDLPSIKTLELRKEILESMVIAATFGYIFPVIKFVKDNAEKLDKMLLRHFVALLLDVIAPPFSRVFAARLADLICAPFVMQALQDLESDLKSQMWDFCNMCMNMEGLLDKVSTSKLKGLVAAM